MTSSRAAGTLCLLSLLLSGCNNASPSNNVTVTFSGVLQQAGSNSHEFTAGRNGEFSFRITALSPNQAAIIGLYIGTPVGGVCGQLGGVSQAGLNTAAMTGPLNRGTYCLGVVDIGALTAATNYTVQLSHP